MQEDPNNIPMSAHVEGGSSLEAVSIDVRVEERLGELSKGNTFYPNIKDNTDAAIGVPQRVDNIIGLLSNFSAEEYSSLYQEHADNGVNEVEIHEKNGERVIKINQPDLKVSSADADALSNPRLIQNLKRLFYVAHKQGSFKLREMSLIDILKQTRGFSGERPNPTVLRNFANDLYLLSRMQFSIDFNVFQGRLRQRKLGDKEVFRRNQRLLDIKESVVKTDSDGFEYLKEIVAGTLLPDVDDYNQYRAVLVPIGYFELEPKNDAARIRLADAITQRFSQRQEQTMKGEPCRMDRESLIRVCSYGSTNASNSPKASNLLEQSLNRLVSVGILSSWQVDGGGNRISSKADVVVVLNPGKDIVENLKPGQLKPANQMTVKQSVTLMKKAIRTYSKTEVARIMMCQVEDLRLYEQGKMVISGEQIKSLRDVTG